MKTTQRIIKILAVTMSMSIVMPALAEAPVYDADAMSQDQDFVLPPDQTQYLPPPPPPDSGASFVPMQAQSTVTVAQSQEQAAPLLNLEQRMQRMEQQINNMQ